MLDFSRLTLADAPVIKPLLTHSYSRLCDYVFGTLLLWRDMWPTEFAIYNDTVFFRLESENGRKGYLLPVGGDLGQALDVLDSYQKGHKLLYNVPEAQLDMLQQRYSGVSFEAVDSGGDYIYDAAAMAAVKGRKLHGQRNHINYFDRTWTFRFEKITDSNVRDVRAFVERDVVSDSSDLFREGTRKTFELLDNLDVYDFSSLALYVGEELIGFTFGSLLGDTLYVSIEQADRNFRGAYPKLVSAFVSEHLDKGAAFVNREDDLGDEGLRMSKLAWNPCEIALRFIVAVD